VLDFLFSPLGHQREKIHARTEAQSVPLRWRREVWGSPGAEAHDDKKYPDFGGQWNASRNRQSICTSKAPRLGQVPPDTEYHAQWKPVCMNQNLVGQARSTSPASRRHAAGDDRDLSDGNLSSLRDDLHVIEYLTQQRAFHRRRASQDEEFDSSYQGYSIGHGS